MSSENIEVKTEDDTDPATAIVVKSRMDFVRFVELLRDDFVLNGQQWENPDLINFLDAIVRWTEGCDGYYKNIEPNVDPEKASWHGFANILRAARVYE